MNASLRPISPRQWDRAAALHLANRAGFGTQGSLVDRLAGMPPNLAVRTLVDYETRGPAAVDPDFVVTLRDPREERKELQGLSDEEQRKRRGEWRRAERGAVDQLKAWWLARMLTSPRPLEEKMTLFWHGHFATSAQKVNSSRHNYELNKTFRTMATGDVKALTLAVGRSPAMLRYLDNNRNVKARPNENWAREMLELFTMGIGHYTEEDIKAAARAFTGWSMDYKEFMFRQNQHDTGDKTFLGRTGPWTGEDIIDIVFAHPATAEWFARKLWSYFAYPDPEPQIVLGLAETLRQSRYQLKPMLSRMFHSQAFYSERAMGTQIKSPAQYVVQLCAHLGIDDPPWPELVRAMRGMGQDLFYPPNVKGWDGNRAWINTNTLLLRYNLPAQVVSVASRPPKRDEKAMMPAMGAMAGKPAGKGGEVPRLREFLSELPPAERREMAMEMRDATPEERRQMMRQAVVEARQPYALKRGMSDLRFTTAGQCVEALAQRCMAVRLSVDQKRVLLSALGYTDPRAPATLEQIPDEKWNAALHLLTSMAEYQVC